MSNYGGSLNWYYSCTLPAPGGNTGADPQFVNKAKLDLRLKASSPLVDGW